LWTEKKKLQLEITDSDAFSVPESRGIKCPIKQKVSVYIRIRLDDGSQPYCPVVWQNKKSLKPHWCLVKGVPEEHPEGTYHLRYRLNGKQVWEHAGDNPDNVIAFRQARLFPLANPNTETGQRLADEHNKPAPRTPKPKEDRLTLDDTVRIYLTTGKAAEKDWRKHTLQCYALALKLFTESCQKTYMDEIDETICRHSRFSCAS